MTFTFFASRLNSICSRYDLIKFFFACLVAGSLMEKESFSFFSATTFVIIVDKNTENSSTKRLANGVLIIFQNI